MGRQPLGTGACVCHNPVLFISPDLQVFSAHFSFAGSVCSPFLSLLPSPPHPHNFGDKFLPIHLCPVGGGCGLSSFLVSVHVCQAGFGEERPTLHVGPCFCWQRMELSSSVHRPEQLALQLWCLPPKSRAPALDFLGSGYLSSALPTCTPSTSPTEVSVSPQPRGSSSLFFHSNGIAGLLSCAWLYYDFGGFELMLVQQALFLGISVQAVSLTDTGVPGWLSLNSRQKNTFVSQPVVAALLALRYTRERGKLGLLLVGPSEWQFCLYVL